MNVTLTVWLITIAVTIAFFVYEFYAHVRKPHEPTLGESARWSAFYIGLALLFGVGVGLVSGWDFGGEYFAEEVRRELAERYGDTALYKGGLAVRTSLDPSYQSIADAVMREGLIRYDRRHEIGRAHV